MRKLIATVLAAALPLAVTALVAAPAMAQKPAKPAAKAGGDVAAGKKVYEATCAMCHGTLAAKKPTLPNASNFFKGEFKRTGGKDAEMDKMIKLGGAGYGKGASAQMPPQPQLSEKDRKNVIAFIKTLKSGK